MTQEMKDVGQPLVKWLKRQGWNEISGKKGAYKKGQHGWDIILRKRSTPQRKLLIEVKGKTHFDQHFTDTLGEILFRPHNTTHYNRLAIAFPQKFEERLFKKARKMKGNWKLLRKCFNCRYVFIVSKNKVKAYQWNSILTKPKIAKM